MRLIQAIATLMICCSVAANADTDGTVKLSATFLAFPKEEIEGLIKKDITKPLEVSDLSALIANDKGRIIAAPCLTVQDRKEAVLFDLNTSRMPQDVGVEFAVYRPTNSNHSVAAIAKPQDFMEIGVGLNFRATTVISEDKKTVLVDIVSEFIDDVEMLQRKSNMVHSNNAESNLTFDMASIAKHSVLICTELKDGESIVLAGGCTNKDNEMIYIVLTCKIMSLPQSSQKSSAACRSKE
jgi:type II secretory pathway component GspD/PulD (secretin)